MDIETPNPGKTGCGRTMEREFPPELESIFRYFKLFIVLAFLIKRSKKWALGLRLLIFQILQSLC